MKEWTYTRCGDYYIPGLKLSERLETPIGKYSRICQRYLKEYHPRLYHRLLLSEKLYPHLVKIEQTVQERMGAMLPKMMKTAGVTEELKAQDPMRWVEFYERIKGTSGENSNECADFQLNGGG